MLVLLIIGIYPMEGTMKKLLAVAVAPLFVTFLWAGQATRSETTTTKTTTWNGTLVDAGCQTTHTEHKSTTTNPDQSTTTSSRTETKVDCPVTTETTTFGMILPEGKYVRFDEPSNTRIVEVVKNNKQWRKYIGEHAPLKVHVVGTANGDVVVLDTIR